MNTDNNIFRLFFNKNLLRYFNDEFISINGKTFLIDVDEKDIFLISSTEILSIESFPEEISLDISSNQIGKFLNSWYSRNRLLKIISLSIPIGGRFWLTERIYSSGERLLRDFRSSSIAFNLEIDKNTLYDCRAGEYLISLTSVYKFDIPDEEDIKRFMEINNS